MVLHMFAITGHPTAIGALQGDILALRKVFHFKMHINGVVKLFSRATDDRSDQKAS